MPIPIFMGISIFRFRFAPRSEWHLQLAGGDGFSPQRDRTLTNMDNEFQSGWNNFLP